MSSQDSTIFTPEYEAAVADFASSLIEHERQNYDSKLEPFKAHAEKIRAEVAESLNDFRKSYMTGYKILLDVVAKRLPEGSDLTPYIAKTDNIEKRAMQGELFCTIFGFTNEVMQTFYEAAYSLFEQKRVQDAHNAFLFLVTIAPTAREFWLNYGYSALQLGKLQVAIESYGHAYWLDPTQSDAYLATAGIYLRLEEKNSAYAICDLGLDYARENEDALWAKELSKTLEEGKNLISQGVNLCNHPL